ncbi:hypothetical protein [Winogradskyella sp.]|uniref:hypothetical protein n=1 Tax=Winogradskyella sp. TaxID=1883156 RepID=UPI0025D94771|nr:hypothetical protein [Winogradskyella sp.]
MKNLYALLFIFSFSFISFAQAPELMSYQALVRNADGDLIQTTSVGIRISILQNSDTGTAVYTETHTVTTNENGLVTLSIGSGTTTDDFSSIDWGNGTYYIKSETDPAGGTNYTIAGTSQLLSVPYALYAKNSGDSNNNSPNTPQSGNIGAYSQNSAYAWDAETNTWYSRSFSGAGQSIIESKGNIGAASQNSAYAWNDENNTWYARSMSGSYIDLKAGNGNIGAMSQNSAYAWNKETNTWYARSMSGTGIKIIVTSDGNVGAISQNSAYAWNKETNTWYAQSVSGTAISIIESNGNIGVVSQNSAYSWNKETNTWYAQSISGAGLGIIGSTND